jgi:hypothetical protein
MKHAKTLLRRKDCCTYLLLQQNVFEKGLGASLKCSFLTKIVTCSLE